MYRFKRLIAVVAALSIMGSSSLQAKSLLGKVKKTSGKETYIVQLENAPVAAYNGGVQSLVATRLAPLSKSRTKSVTKQKLNVKSAPVVAYKKFLTGQRSEVIRSAAKTLKLNLKPSHVYETVLNGFAADLTAEEAQKLRSLSGVKSVQVSETHYAHSDRGPTLIKAPEVWGGAINGVQAQGEGILVGIIDTGFHLDHPSFSGVDPVSGYQHINPLGSGNYLGECSNQPSLCNDKLIGSYNFVGGSVEPEDEDSHGSHVGSTAIGNYLSFDLGNGNSFDLSGVAPRANVIAYKIADSTGSASGTAVIGAIEQAVNDGVDVINYSFGADAPFASPWTTASTSAFLNARQAGVMVLTSAGNSGPGPTTISSPANAPWMTSVAASTHDRGAFPGKSLINMSGGDTTAPGNITGQSLSGAVTATIVYAGDFSNGDTNPEQCLNPFPANTFSGQIVVCDRGDIARVEKAINVAAGGAGGFVLANVSGGAANLADDLYVVPGIHIASADGDVLKTWLASGAGHMATVAGTDGPVGTVPGNADVIANFSSRGPNGAPSGILKPSIAAPGAGILAADLDPIEFGFKSGTSMASPHAAGAAALIVQLRPNWTPGEIHSALMTTGITNLRKEDASTPADPFDMGGGRIDIPRAINAGLLMDDTVQNFLDSNPATGGDPKTLNLPGLSNPECVVPCQWNRTFKAAGDATWTVSFTGSTGLTLSTDQTSFQLSEGQTQALEITANTTSVTNGSWLFGSLVLTPDDSSLTTTSLPVAIRSFNSTFTGDVALQSTGGTGSHEFANLSSVAASSVVATGHLVQATVTNSSFAGDSASDSPFDNLQDGVEFETMTVPANSQALIVELSSTAVDADLFIGIDADLDGEPDQGEIVGLSATSTSDEKVIIDLPQAGTYWILVHNFQASALSVDNYQLEKGMVSSSASTKLTLSAPTTLDGSTAFGIDMDWTDLNPVDTKWFGVVQLGTAGDTDFLGRAQFSIERDGTEDTVDDGGDTGSSGGGSLFWLFALLPLVPVLRKRRTTETS